MSLINFPNVPNVPGVPVLFRSLTVPSVGALVNMALGGIAESIFGAVIWGVFEQDGKAALEPDSFLDIDYKNDSRVSQYPQEAGAFASYNKVGTPYDCRVRMAIGADKATRATFLEKCDAMLKTIDLYTVVTPEATYFNACLQSYNYRRESRNGATMLTVDLWFTEVRKTAVIAFRQSQDADASEPVSDGQVQTYEVGTANSVTGSQLAIQ